VFTSIVINGDKMPRYVICCEVLANTLMFHLKTKHGSLADRGRECFKRKPEI
jgi:hypothetical protein